MTYIEQLAENFIKIERISQACFTASIFKNKKNKSPWKVIHRISVDDQSSILADSNANSHIKEELMLKLLDNRTYFNICRCCAKLHHVDNMNEQVCNVCHVSKIDVAQWAETYFINNYIKPYRSEYDAICIETSNDFPEFFEESDSDALGLAYCNLSWGRPHEATPIWKIVKRFEKPVLAQDNHLILQASRLILNNRNYFHYCIFCGEYEHKDHLNNRKCDSCMHKIFGVVY